LRIGSLKVSQIFASRFGGQNLVQTIDFFLKSTTIKLGCIFKIKFYNTNCVHLKGQKPKCENDFWPFSHVNWWEIKFYGGKWYVVEKVFAMATHLPLRTFKFESKMENLKLWILDNIFSHDIEFYTLMFDH
jgi:hypothetical protein